MDTDASRDEPPPFRAPRIVWLAGAFAAVALLSTGALFHTRLTAERRARDAEGEAKALRGELTALMEQFLLKQREWMDELGRRDDALHTARRQLEEARRAAETLRPAPAVVAEAPSEPEPEPPESAATAEALPEAQPLPPDADDGWRATVLAASAARKQALVDRGAADGVRAGEWLAVYREGRYLGGVRAETPFRHMTPVSLLQVGEALRVGDTLRRLPTDE